MESRFFGHGRIRGWIVVCMAVIAVVGFAATAGASGRQETSTAKTGASKYAGQTLTLLMWGSGWDEAMQASAAEFEKQFGVKIRNESQESTSDGLIKLQAQKGKPTVDVWFATPYILYRANPGLLADIDVSYIKGKEDLRPNTIGKNYVTCYFYPFGITYRTDLVSKPITQWEDLWDPSLKGKISAPSAGFFSGNFLVLSAYLNGGSEKNIDPGFAKIKKLLPNILSFYDSDQTPRQALAQGEAAVAVGGADYYGFLVDKGIPAKLVAPKPCPMEYDVLTVIKGGNEALAHEFINFMVQPFAQQRTVVEWKCIPVNTKVAPSPELKDAVPKLEDMANFDIATIARELPGWIDRWNREIVIGK
jgi:putative spermidine/putrescine transport system substrate-binding protein